MARPTGPSDGTSVGAPSDGVAAAAAQASRRRQHPTDAARQSTLDHRPNGPLAKKIAPLLLLRSTRFPFVVFFFPWCHTLLRRVNGCICLSSLSICLVDLFVTFTPPGCCSSEAHDRTDRPIQRGSKMTEIHLRQTQPEMPTSCQFLSIAGADRFAGI